MQLAAHYGTVPYACAAEKCGLYVGWVLDSGLFFAFALPFARSGSVFRHREYLAGHSFRLLVSAGREGRLCCTGTMAGSSSSESVLRSAVGYANANANANEPSRDGNLRTRVCQSRANLSVCVCRRR
jgi:hypothetical protein